MNINDVSAILRLDKSLREDVRKAEQQRDEIDSHIAESVKELHDSRYAKLNSELEAYEKTKRPKPIAAFPIRPTSIKNRLTP